MAACALMWCFSCACFVNACGRQETCHRNGCALWAHIVDFKPTSKWQIFRDVFPIPSITYIVHRADCNCILPFCWLRQTAVDDCVFSSLFFTAPLLLAPSSASSPFFISFNSLCANRINTWCYVTHVCPFADEQFSDFSLSLSFSICDFLSLFRSETETERGKGREHLREITLNENV